MTTPTPTPEKQNLSASPDSEETNPSSPDATGFFKRVRQKFNPEEPPIRPEAPPIHPSEAAEIVIMEELDNSDDRT
jgi:hypothetical protein